MADPKTNVQCMLVLQMVHLADKQDDKTKYKRIQALFSKSRFQAVDLCQTGVWMNLDEETPDSILEYWHWLFDSKPLANNRPIVQVYNTEWNMIEQIALEEV